MSPDIVGRLQTLILSSINLSSLAESVHPNSLPECQSPGLALSSSWTSSGFMLRRARHNFVRHAEIQHSIFYAWVSGASVMVV